MAPHPRYPHVFTPLTIGATTVRNRILVPAHTTNYGENNLPSERHLAYHRARAAGGAGLNIFEGIRVHRSSLGRQQGVNGFDPACIPHFARIADAVCAEGGKLFGQIIHLGRHIDGNYARTPAWSASDIPWTAAAPPPHPMTEEEIALITSAFADVAANLINAGFNGIELTMSHGHLLQQFLSPASNQRTDSFGGSLENRLRFPLNTLRAVRQKIGPDQTLGIRISADEYLPGGLTLDDMTGIVRHIVDQVQVDFVNVSHSAYHGSYTVSTQMADMAFRLEDFQPLTHAISAAVEGAAHKPVVMTVCRYQNVAQAEQMLASGATDMVGMARAHIADPAIVSKARSGHEHETTPCIGCNQGCAGMLALNLAITCLTNPAAGREAQWPAPGPSNRIGQRKRVLVVGGGPGGMEAAATAAELGHEVVLAERSDALGGSLLWATRMPLRREFGALLDSQKARMDRASVSVRLGFEADSDSALGYDAVIFATGATPRAQVLPSGVRTLTLEASLSNPNALGDNVTLVDMLGTWSVVSVAEWLADLGKSVTLVSPVGAPGWTISMYSGFAMRKRLYDKRVRVIQGHALADFKDGMVQLTDLSLGTDGEQLVANSVIAPLAAQPRTPKDTATGRERPRTFTIGDCQSPRTALEAVFEGHEAARGL